MSVQQRLIVVCVAVALASTGGAWAQPSESEVEEPAFGKTNVMDWLREWPRPDDGFYERVKQQYSEELKVYGYGLVFQKFQEELEEWMDQYGADGPHRNLLAELKILNEGFTEGDYDRFMAEVDPADTSALREAALAFADNFLEHHPTGTFQEKWTDRGWFPGDRFVSFDDVGALSESKAVDFLSRVDTVRRLLDEFKLEAVRETIVGIRLAADRWEHFLADGKTMYPWEATLNAVLVGGGTIQRPPMNQWVLLHPRMGVSVDPESSDAETARNVLCVEALGHVWYHWNDELVPEDGLGWWGISALAVFRDDMGPGAGLGVEYGRTVSLGVSWHDDDDDGDWFDNPPYLVMSVDLLAFTRESAKDLRLSWDEAASRFSRVAGWQ